MRIYPRCKADFAQTYISAEGYVFPCCWIGNLPQVEEYKKFFGDDLEQLSILNRPLDEILVDPLFSKIENSWEEISICFSPCKQFCSSPIQQNKIAAEGQNDVLRVYLSSTED